MAIYHFVFLRYILKKIFFYYLIKIIINFESQIQIIFRHYLNFL